MDFKRIQSILLSLDSAILWQLPCRKRRSTHLEGVLPFFSVFLAQFEGDLISMLSPTIDLVHSRCLPVEDDKGEILITQRQGLGSSAQQSFEFT